MHEQRLAVVREFRLRRVVGIVQARAGSRRFPSKMLARLSGRPLLEWVLRRVARARLLDQVVLATSDLQRDDSLAELASSLGIAVFRGSEQDVVGRFIGAATMCQADVVVRICADNPFIDPLEVDRLVEFFEQDGFDYACNHQARLGSRYADGFGAEILTRDLLEHIGREASAPEDREHVTRFVWHQAERFRIGAVPAPTELAYPTLRFDVDTPEDLAFLETLISKGADLNSSGPELVDLIRRARAT